MDGIRIIELPKCKAVTSGYAFNEAPFSEGGTIMRFMEWWTDYDKKRTDRWFNRDFIMYGREEKAHIWYYAIPDGTNVNCDYKTIDFEGGLYAVAVAIDSNSDDEKRVYAGIREWINNNDAFDLDERPGHYDLCTIITPECVGKALGYEQLEIYVPIKLRTK